MGQFSQQAPQILAGVSFLSSLLEGQGIKAQGEAAEAAANYNARLARDEGYREEQRVRREGMRWVSGRAVAANKAGFAMVGTPLEALIADAETLEREALTARAQGLDAYQLGKAEGKAARASSRRGQAASVIGGLASAGQTYYGLRYPGGSPRPRKP